MPNGRVINLDPLSITSLFVKTTVNGRTLGMATGFVVKKESAHFLITNWHVVSGRRPETGEPLSPTGGIPDEILIGHHLAAGIGAWRLVPERLRDSEGTPLWIEHERGQAIDVVALRLQNIDAALKMYPFDLSLSGTDILVRPAMSVSIIGFPLGLAVDGAYPIWKTGHIASDPDLYYQGLPAFLIDATTREGMSGSPVVLRIYGSYVTSDGGTVIGEARTTKFLGVYSNRIADDIEIGVVWRPEVITEILRRAG
jgi:hypothetical protein